METARPDGLVHDPFAERLAGERGMAIAKGMPFIQFMCFGIGIRIRFLDDLIIRLVASHSVRTVLSIGCGLDSRPWRMELPADLRWIEVDFPDMLAYKDAAMGGAVPHCHLERIAADLNVESQRKAVFAAAGDGPALMITEGLLMYLPGDSVEALAAAAQAAPGIQYWLLDVSSRELSERMAAGLQEIEKVRSAQALYGQEILDVLGRSGWRALEHRSYTRDSMEVAEERIKQFRAATEQPGAPPPPPPLVDDPSGVHLFGRK